MDSNVGAREVRSVTKEGGQTGRREREDSVFYCNWPSLQLTGFLSTLVEKRGRSIRKVTYFLVRRPYVLMTDVACKLWTMR